MTKTNNTNKKDNGKYKRHLPLSANAKMFNGFCIEPEISCSFFNAHFKDFPHIQESRAIYELQDIHEQPRQIIVETCKTITDFYKDRITIGENCYLSNGFHFHIEITKCMFGRASNLIRSKHNIMEKILSTTPLWCKPVMTSDGIGLLSRPYTNHNYGGSSYFIQNEPIENFYTIEYRLNNVFDERLVGYYLFLTKVLFCNDTDDILKVVDKLNKVHDKHCIDYLMCDTDFVTGCNYDGWDSGGVCHCNVTECYCHEDVECQCDLECHCDVNADDYDEDNCTCREDAEYYCTCSEDAECHCENEQDLEYCESRYSDRMGEDISTTELQYDIPVTLQGDDLTTMQNNIGIIIDYLKNNGYIKFGNSLQSYLDERFTN